MVNILFNRTEQWSSRRFSGGDNLRIFLSKLSCFFRGSLRFDLETLDSPARCFTPFNGKGRLYPLHNSPRISFRCSLYMEWWWSNIYWFFFQAAVSPVHEIISRELATLPSFLFVEEDFARHHRAFSWAKEQHSTASPRSGGVEYDISNVFFFHFCGVYFS